MIDGILRSLHDVEGVQATLVLDGEAQILAHRAHPVFSLELLHEVGRAIGAALDSVQLVHEDWELITASCLEGKLLLRNLAQPRSAPGRASALALVADGRLNPSFAGVAIRVAATRLKGAFDLGGPSQGAGTPAPLHFGEGLPTLTPLPMPLTPSPSPSSSSSSLAMPLLLTPPPATLADPAMAAWLVKCTKALAASVGPMAKVFVKEALARVCGDQPLTRDRAPALVGELERHIEDASERAQFRKAMSS